MSDQQNPQTQSAEEVIGEAFGPENTPSLSPRLAAGMTEGFTTDPSQHSAQRIKDAVTNPTISPTLADGMEIRSAGLQVEIPAEQETPEEKARYDAALAIGKRLNDEEEAEKAKGQWAIQTLASEVVLEAADNLEEATNRLASTLDDLDPEAAEELAWKVALAHYGLTEELYEKIDLSDEDYELLQEATELIEAEAKRIHGLRKLSETEEKIEELLPAAAEAMQAKLQSVAAEVARDFGYRDDSDATYAMNAAIQFAETELGWDLSTAAARGDWGAVDAGLRSALAVLEEEDKNLNTRVFQQGVLNAASTDVSEGLTVYNPVLGEHAPMNPMVLPQRPVVDSDRVVARSQSKAPSRQSIRESVSSSERTSVADGITVNGKPSTVDIASGAKARHEREEQDKIDRDVALFGIHRL